MAWRYSRIIQRRILCHACCCWHVLTTLVSYCLIHYALVQLQRLIKELFSRASDLTLRMVHVLNLLSHIDGSIACSSALSHTIGFEMLGSLGRIELEVGFILDAVKITIVIGLRSLVRITSII